MVGPDAGLDAIDYFEKRFPDLDKMPTSGDNANCAEWLISITTKVPLLAACILPAPSHPANSHASRSSEHVKQDTLACRVIRKHAGVETEMRKQLDSQWSAGRQNWEGG